MSEGTEQVVETGVTQHAMTARNIELVRRFWKAISESDVEVLDEICLPDLRFIEPEVSPEPMGSLAEFRAYIAQAGNRGAFDAIEFEPIGDSLLINTSWTPPAGGEAQRWRVVWSFWNGKIGRLDGHRVA